MRENWDSLRLAICQQWMTQNWRTEQKARCNKIAYRSEGHHKEGPMNYFHRKLRALRVSYSGMDEYDLVHEILDNAPNGWMKFFNVEINNLDVLCAQIQEHQSLLKEEEDLSKKVELLMEAHKGNHGSQKAQAGAAKTFFRAKAHAAEARPIGFHDKLPPPPFPKRDDVVTKKGKTPAQKGARPCANCGSGNHWDYECPHRRQRKAVKVNFVGASEDLLQAMDDYNEAALTSGGEEEEAKKEEEDSSEEDSGNESSSN